jgi:hypothetical protein
MAYRLIVLAAAQADLEKLAARVTMARGAER